ncbi:hypothetical protein AYL99_11912 [Fonsecaea erecta]|uniref:Uncharacterized protein n=1 Tax=Fonsecaea erecta TaxID=1367422 RepID=A0A178Z285_9EURO|nr:hypothetical protein AYL99_11912 [Fonsecaea erecta]OAP53890.1 hypothetical protein AYL99_11912 [Fonsecaea erecta]
MSNSKDIKVIRATSMPAFQTLFIYVLLNFVYTGYTLYKYGFEKWLQMVVKDGWKYIILAIFDVEGNYFTVLAYRHTTILSAQLVNFWAIVVAGHFLPLPPRTIPLGSSRRRTPFSLRQVCP